MRAWIQGGVHRRGAYGAPVKSDGRPPSLIQSEAGGPLRGGNAKIPNTVDGIGDLLWKLLMRLTNDDV